MATHTRLRKRAELKARKLTRKTFRSLCMCVAMFLSAAIVIVVVRFHGAPSKGELSTSLLMFLGQGHIFLPIRPVPTTPKQ